MSGGGGEEEGKREGEEGVEWRKLGEKVSKKHYSVSVLHFMYVLYIVTLLHCVTLCYTVILHVCTVYCYIVLHCVTLCYTS